MYVLANTFFQSLLIIWPNMRFSHHGLTINFTVLSLLYFADGHPASVINEFRVPQGLVEDDVGNGDGSASPLFNFTSYLHRRQGQTTSPEWLRIMPLGASIVAGVRSTPEDGFRKPLRDHLRSLGYKVNMVGSQ